MSREDPYFRLRIPESLKAQVEAASEKNKRSMTAEILARLEASFGATLFAPEQEEAIRELMREEARGLVKDVFEEYADRVQHGNLGELG